MTGTNHQSSNKSQENRKTKPPTHSLCSTKKLQPHARNFTHEKTAKIPIMKNRDAISLTPFWAFGQSAAAGPLVQTRFKVDRLRARSRAICLNEFAQA
jgi:hypothetical protein